MFLTRSRVDQAAQRLANRIFLQRDTVGTEFGLGLRYICALARLAGDDAGRNAHRRGARGHGFDDNGVAADLRAVTHQKAAQHLGTSAHHHIFAQRGVTFGALVQRSATQRHAMVDGAAVADFGCFANDHSHPVVKEHPFADHGARMDLDPREPA